jgi:tyrosyl-tRNA synthetase
MSKSYGNSIGLTDEPKDMFGRVMSIEDGAMRDWFTLLTSVPETEIATLLAGHPREAKARLGQELTAFFHGAEAGKAARDGFDRQFRDHEVPADVPVVAFPKDAPAEGVPLANLLKELGLEKSTSDARRSIEQGGVKIDGEVVKDPKVVVKAPAKELLIQVGKRRFARVRAGGS